MPPSSRTTERRSGSSSCRVTGHTGRPRGPDGGRGRRRLADRSRDRVRASSLAPRAGTPRPRCLRPRGPTEIARSFRTGGGVSVVPAIRWSRATAPRCRVAMKMQNEPVRPRDGVVSSVAVGAGQTIEVGDCSWHPMSRERPDRAAGPPDRPDRPTGEARMRAASDGASSSGPKLFAMRGTSRAVRDLVRDRDPDLYAGRCKRPPGGSRLGLPGDYPFTRGVQRRCTAAVRTMRQYAGFRTAEETNRASIPARAGSDRSFGRVRLPTQMGYDSDAPRRTGRWAGVASDRELADMAVLLDASRSAR